MRSVAKSIANGRRIATSHSLLRKRTDQAPAPGASSSVLNHANFGYNPFAIRNASSEWLE